MMINRQEQDERNFLKEMKLKLQKSLEQIDDNVKNYAREMQQQKEYLWENKAGMDHVEKVSVRQSVTQTSLTGEAALARKKRLRKLMQSPWFGRVDFVSGEQEQAHPVYIGVHNYYDETEKRNLIHDWRAPISTMFYDFELGPAGYDSPSGYVEGEILLKRQYRIRQGKMEYMLENSLNIHDDILQKELSKSSDDKMKDIVSTIQRDQNAIIRNETSHILIIQGVAGSGKTSIALHRIAFLLYRFKDTISSKDILIISPNKVFADYISNVLPELGEEKIPEMEMEELASELLENKFRFQTFFDQVSLLLEKNSKAFSERIKFKSTFGFLNHLNAYVAHIENNFFVPEDIVVKRYPVPAWFIRERFDAYHRLPVLKRFNAIARDIESNVLVYYKYEINGKERNEIRSAVKKMFKITNLRQLYKDFYGWLNRSELLKMAKGSTYEYADVFPLIYLKTLLEGTEVHEKVKHLLVDEMQDYTPVQYAVLSRQFPCKKTILGDAGQAVNIFGFSTAGEIARVFPGADIMQLNRSYRSTLEITNVAQQISRNPDFEVVERHGEVPAIYGCANTDEQLGRIKKIIAGFSTSGFNSLGIILKTQSQADKLFEALEPDFPEVMIITADSAAFINGINISSVHMAKGLEFDQVIVPDADVDNFNQPIDRNLLYVACTRAMHRLGIFYVGEITKFLVQDTLGA